MRLVVTIAALLAAGCFDPALQGLRCESSDDCAEGLTCDPEGWCRAVSLDPDAATVYDGGIDGGDGGDGGAIPGELSLIMDEQPAAQVATAGVTIRFHASRTEAVVLCVIDGAAEVACESPLSLADLTEGDHTVDLRAADGEVESAPVRVGFRVDLTPPVLTLTAPPATTGADVTVSFESNEADATFRCRFDDGTSMECDSPLELLNLANGPHELAVIAVDAAGHQSAEETAGWTVDRDAFVTSITSRPGTVSGANVSFSFTASRTPVTFTCTVDGTAAACTSPKLLTLAEGRHTFSVQASDAGSDGSTATHTWDVDTTPPVVTITPVTSPSNNPLPGIAFTVNDAGAAVTCALDDGAAVACSTSPFRPATLADGSHTVTITAVDAVGNAAAPASVTFTIDTTPPVVAITSGPAGTTSSTGASFVFTVSEGTPSCSLDGSSFGPCTSGTTMTYASLSASQHTFHVRALDAAGNTSVERTHTWTVDTAGPTVTITSAPPALTNQTAATITYTVSEGAVTCTLNGVSATCAAGSLTLTSLAAGPYTAVISATDTSGNVSSATVSWTVDLTAPVVTFTSGPSGLTNQTSLTFGWSSSKAGTATCKLDGAAPVPCDTATSESLVATEAAHTLLVSVTDAAGNTGSASRAFTVDITPPVVTISSAPPATSTSASAGFVFSVTDGTPACSLDSAAFGACTSSTTMTYSSLSPGPHTFHVRATDAAGNTSAERTHTWTVDVAAPTVTVTSAPPALTNQNGATITYTVSDGTVTCTLNGAAAACTAGSMTVSGLTSGPYSAVIKATNSAGNSTSVTVTWTVDLTVPVISFTGGPTGFTNQTTHTFTWTSTESGTTRCQVNLAAIVACDTATSETMTVTEGAYTLTVTVTDAAGNTGTATRSFTVDTIVPTVTITEPDPGDLKSESTTVTFTTGGATSTKCSMSTTFVTCTSGWDPGTLSSGSKTVTVRAYDDAGNMAEAKATFTVDNTTPTVTVTGPTGTSGTSASITWTVSETGTTQTCSLDGAAHVACTSPWPKTGLANGAHTVVVKATDAVGHVGTSATFNFTVDAVGPVTTFTAPAARTRSPATVSFSFSETATSVQCSVDSGAFSTCTSGFQTADLTDGAHNVVVKATDAAGNVATSAARSFTVDDSKPTISITKPTGTTGLTTSAEFTVTEVGGGTIASRRCRLDTGTFATCTSPWNIPGLLAGPHTVIVEATDDVGNVQTVTSASWTVDGTGPTLSISKPAPDAFTRNSTSVLWIPSESATFRCKLDAGTYASCTSGWTVSGLADGWHGITIEATDSYGNKTETARSWQVDGTVPSVSFTSGPGAYTGLSSASFGVSCADTTGCTVTCALTGPGGSLSCNNTSAIVTGLNEGPYTVTLYALDGVGNSTQTSYNFTVDYTPPVLTLDLVPLECSSASSATFEFHATDDNGVLFRCSKNNGAFLSCSSPKTYTSLTTGGHHFEVYATDPAGNTSPIQSYDWIRSANCFDPP
jgi:large repetitive protein